MNTLKLSSKNDDRNTNIINTTTFLTPGQRLRQEREAKGLSPDLIAKQLFLSEKIITALENDDYAKMIAPVYARGYLLSYARLLQIPTEPLLAEFAKISSTAETADNFHHHNAEIQTSRSTSTRNSYVTIGHCNDRHHWIIYTMIVVVAITLTLWGYNHYKQYKNSSNETPSTTTTTITTDHDAVNKGSQEELQTIEKALPTIESEMEQVTEPEPLQTKTDESTNELTAKTERKSAKSKASKTSSTMKTTPLDIPEAKNVKIDNSL